MMVVLFGVIASLQMVAGVLVFFGAQSAVHETLAALLFGLGMVQYILANILDTLQRPPKP